MQPAILSMEVDDDDAFDFVPDSHTVFAFKYLIIYPKTFDRDTLSFPLQSLPNLL
jgi:hypothetical protein